MNPHYSQQITWESTWYPSINLCSDTLQSDKVQDTHLKVYIIKNKRAVDIGYVDKIIKMEPTKFSRFSRHLRIFLV